MTAERCALVCGAGGFTGAPFVKRLKAEGFWMSGADALPAPKKFLKNKAPAKRRGHGRPAFWTGEVGPASSSFGLVGALLRNCRAPKTAGLDFGSVGIVRRHHRAGAFDRASSGALRQPVIFRRRLTSAVRASLEANHAPSFPLHRSVGADHTHQPASRRRDATGDSGCGPTCALAAPKSRKGRRDIEGAGADVRTEGRNGFVLRLAGVFRGFVTVDSKAVR